MPTKTKEKRLANRFTFDRVGNPEDIGHHEGMPAAGLGTYQKMPAAYMAHNTMTRLCDLGHKQRSR